MFYLSKGLHNSDDTVYITFFGASLASSSSTSPNRTPHWARGTTLNGLILLLARPIRARIRVSRFLKSSHSHRPIFSSSTNSLKVTDEIVLLITSPFIARIAMQWEPLLLVAYASSLSRAESLHWVAYVVPCPGALYVDCSALTS